MNIISVNNFRDAIAKHGPGNTATFGRLDNFKTEQNSSDSTMVNKYHSVDARYNSIKNLPPDLRMKLRETLRQKMDNKDTTNTYVVNNVDAQVSPIYKSPPYTPNNDQTGAGKTSKASDFLNPYKSPPFSDAYYKVIYISQILVRANIFRFKCLAFVFIIKFIFFIICFF